MKGFAIVAVLIIALIMLVACDMINLSSELPLTSEGLVAYYAFEGDASDQSGYGNHGSISNADFVDGKIGKALEFSGKQDSYVQIPYSASLNTPRAVTMSAWASVWDNRTWHSALIYRAGEQPTRSGFRDRVYTFWVTEGGGIHFTSTPEGSGSQETCNATGGSYSRNKWTHFAGVIDTVRGQMKIFIDGVKVAECSYPGDAIRAGDFPLRLGGYFATLGDQSGLTGLLDEVKIYNRALSDIEIRSLAR